LKKRRCTEADQLSSNQPQRLVQWAVCLFLFAVVMAVLDLLPTLSELFVPLISSLGFVAIHEHLRLLAALGWFSLAFPAAILFMEIRRIKQGRSRRWIVRFYGYGMAVFCALYSSSDAPQPLLAALSCFWIAILVAPQIINSKFAELFAYIVSTVTGILLINHPSPFIVFSLAGIALAAFVCQWNKPTLKMQAQNLIYGFVLACLLPILETFFLVLFPGPDSRYVEKIFPVGEEPSYDSKTPPKIYDMAIDSERGWVFATSFNWGRIIRVDIRSRKANWSGPAFYSAYRASMSSDNKRLFVSCIHMTEHIGVWVMDPETFDVQARPINTKVVSFALDSKRNQVGYIMDGRSHVVVMDQNPPFKWIVYGIPGVSSPYTIGYSKREDSYYLSDYFVKPYLFKIPVPNGFQMPFRKYIGWSATNLSIDNENDRLFLCRPFADRLDVRSAKDLELIASLPTRMGVRETSHDSERNLGFAGRFLPGVVDVLDVKTKSKIATIRVAEQIRSIKYDSKSHLLFVACLDGLYTVNIDKVLQSYMHN